MSDLVERLTTKLEPILASEDPRPASSAYHDMSYVLLCYDPQEELELRREVGLPPARLEQGGKRVFSICLAECMQVMESRQSLVRRSLCCVWSLRASDCSLRRAMGRALCRDLHCCAGCASTGRGPYITTASRSPLPGRSERPILVSTLTGGRLPPRAIGGAVEEPLRRRVGPRCGASSV